MSSRRGTRQTVAGGLSSRGEAGVAAAARRRFIASRRRASTRMSARPPQTNVPMIRKVTMAEKFMRANLAGGLTSCNARRA